MQPNMFNVNKPKHEAPLAIGAAIGGLMGAAGVGGLTLISGLALGAMGGALLGGLNQKAPKIQQASQGQTQQQAIAQTPALPPATPMPAAPMTPVASPVQPGVPAPGPDTPIPQDIPVVERPQEAAEASPPTTEEVARGQLEKKRKGRVSTILTTPQSRLEDGEEEGFERLGG